ncbi:MAG: hypothetical protein MK108_04325 [Mariniblastus sp.]|nr:hypothetical protein [Mariniblastus sp.]
MAIPLLMLLLASTACGIQAGSDETDETPLPAWIQQGSFFQDGSDYVLVKTEGCATALDANRELNAEILVVVSETLDRKLGEGAGQQVNLGSEYIETYLIPDGRSIVRPYRDEFTDEIAQRLGKDYGEFFRGYAQLELDQAFYDFARQQWRTEQTRLRLMAIALIGLVVLALLTTTYGYLRVNQATRGFYSIRLLTIGLAVILLLAAAILWLFGNISL